MPSPEAVPPWLQTMRSLNGTSETPGSADNPKILAMADTIGEIYPEMADYCNSYRHDSIPWCGLTEAYCMASVGVRPPFGEKDTDKFLWVGAWPDDPNYVRLKVPRLGALVCLTRSGGGHITTYEATSGANYMCRGGNQSDAVNLKAFPQSNVTALLWPKDVGTPPPLPSHDLPVLRKGDTGPDVAYMQTLIPKWIDGDFGPTTESLLKEFQRDAGLAPSGICDESTWAKLLEEPGPPAKPGAPTLLYATKGTCSWFGGPEDHGVKPDEGLAFITNVKQAPQLFLSEQPPGTTGLARRLNPEMPYIACRWDYKRTPRSLLLSEVALVRATKTGKQLLAFPADWGPNEKTGRVADLSPGLMRDLGIETDDEVSVSFPKSET
jgi:uncharacterized protein (TIGR02594 family)